MCSGHAVSRSNNTGQQSKRKEKRTMYRKIKNDNLLSHPSIQPCQPAI